MQKYPFFSDSEISKPKFKAKQNLFVSLAMTLESLESMAVTDKKRFAGIPSWIFTKLSSLWVLFSVSKPHDHGNDRPKPERQPPISDPSDIEAFGTPIACPSQQTSPVNQPQILNPIVQLFRDRDMGKTVLGFVMPMTTCLLSVYSKESPPRLMQLTLMSLCTGLAALWNGILLRETFPRFANAIEQLGAAAILLAFFGVISSFLPQSLIWGSWLCFALSILPFFLSYLPT